MSEPSELLRFTTAHLENTVEFLRELVMAESPTGSKVAVDRCVALAAERFEALGARVTRHPRMTVGDILQVDFASEGAPVLILGHLDTVWDEGTLAQMPLRSEGDRVHGPGIFDMKAGVALAWTALRALRETRQLNRAVTVLLTTDEETGSIHSRELIEELARHSRAVLVPEPAHGPRGALKTARKGVGDYTIKVRGVPAHAGLDFERGHSAVLELARQIERVSAFTQLDRGLTVSVGMISGGTRRNVVPAEAEAQVDVRIARADDAIEIDAKMKSLVAIDPECRIEVQGGINRPPLERTAAVEKLFRKAQAIASELGFEVDEAVVGGGSDGNLTAGLGVPTLDGLGAVGDGAHAAHEHVLLSELPRRAALLAELIRTV